MSSRDRALFGGATSCYMLRAGEDTVFLDAGSGLLSAPVELPKPPHLLLSHLHLDHLLGLGMYPRLIKPGLETVIHVPVLSGQDPLRLLDGLYAPPFWPVSLAAYSGEVRVKALRLPLQIGEIRVEGIEGCHPGGCLLFRLRCRGKTVVYASDYEYEPQSFARLAELARDADLLLYDGQYTEAEAEAKKGFGHSTAARGLELMERSGARRLLLIHHDPQSTDGQLLEREARLGRENARYAREGEEIRL